mmetsp:Transcript_18627/g.52048  ORF Transcript_18627/g.52048 Transcript_18627/m.52048 type:complete len:187 (+) Transcript_18627:844-1404(+)
MSLSEKENKEARELASAVLNGTIIGRTLQDALQSLSEEDTAYALTKSDPPDVHGIDEKNGGGDNHAECSDQGDFFSVRMDRQSADRITKSFQEAVAESRICHESDKDLAPRALVRGRCDYYNKYGQNWMVVIDRAQIKSRPRKFTKRRRDDRPSLWDRDDDRTAMTTKKELVLRAKIQLLAYGDIP